MYTPEQARGSWADILVISIPNIQMGKLRSEPHTTQGRLPCGPRAGLWKPEYGNPNPGPVKKSLRVNPIPKGQHPPTHQEVEGPGRSVTIAS